MSYVKLQDLQTVADGLAQSILQISTPVESIFHSMRAMTQIVNLQMTLTSEMKRQIEELTNRIEKLESGSDDSGEEWKRG